MMFTDQDETLQSVHKAHSMAITTICDIWKDADGEPLTSNELDDLHHSLEILKDCYAVKELHAAYLVAHQAECSK